MIIDKDNIKILLIILILGLGIGYSYINSDLNINGTAQVNSANWDVHWANVQVSTGSVSASSPTISNQTTVNYSVVLNTPGDYYEFTVDAVNGGSIDAMIDSIDSKLNGATITTLPEYLNYTVTYSDGIELSSNHLLSANTTETYKVRVEYRNDIELNQIPVTNQTLSLQFTVTYRQATSSAQPARINYFYSPGPGFGFASGTIGESISEDPFYNSYQDAIETSETPVFLKAVVSNNVIAQLYVGMEYEENVYYLRGHKGTVDTDYNYTYPYFESNKAVLLEAFGNENCTFEIGGNIRESIICAFEDFSGYTNNIGQVRFEVNGDSCRVAGDGRGHCLFYG